ncbi:MAG: hypothetical protein AAF614_44795 [Chloroflexota bacterium]
MDDSYEATAHSFSVRIWLEERTELTITWRGHVTHVADGARRYVTDLNDISLFLNQYLQQMGVSEGEETNE